MTFWESRDVAERHRTPRMSSATRCSPSQAWRSRRRPSSRSRMRASGRSSPASTDRETMPRSRGTRCGRGGSTHHLLERAPAEPRRGRARGRRDPRAGAGSAELQLAARVEGITQADVREALWERRELVKSWTLRGTLHLHPADELRLWTAARRAVVGAPEDYERDAVENVDAPSSRRSAIRAGVGTARCCSGRSSPTRSWTRSAKRRGADGLGLGVLPRRCAIATGSASGRRRGRR